LQYIKTVLANLLTESAKIAEVSSLSGDREIMARLTDLGISKDAVISAIESYYGITYVDLEKESMPLATLEAFSIDVMRMYKFVPFRSERGVCHLAVADFSAHEVRDVLSRLCSQEGLSARIYFAFSFEIEAWIRNLESSDESGVDIDEGPADIVSYAEQIISRGVDLRASDVHVEIRDGLLQLRYRIDGVLSIAEQRAMPPDQISGLMSRLKLISGMDITERRRSQDGHISDFSYNDNTYDVRVSSIGTLYGEKMVLRIFDKSSGIGDFASLGFSSEDKLKMEKMLTCRHGVIYMGGASGTGKTTTLHTMVDRINTEEINIYTIEDPVERTIPNVNHIQVNPVADITFASVLRSLLRQDPDVVVVGEVRDAETLTLAIRAALTGHLIMTTIHANSAMDIISRIFNMGAEPYLVSASTLGFVSQALVRVLCPACKMDAEPSAAEAMWLKHIQEKYTGVEFDKFYKPCGCSECNGVGYYGRTAVPEIIVVDDEIKELIAGRYEARALLSKLMEGGYIPLELGVFNRAVLGVTSLEEAMKIY